MAEEMGILLKGGCGSNSLNRKEYYFHLPSLKVRWPLFLVPIMHVFYFQNYPQQILVYFGQELGNTNILM